MVPRKTAIMVKDDSRLVTAADERMVPVEPETPVVNLALVAQELPTVQAERVGAHEAIDGHFRCAVEESYLMAGAERLPVFCDAVAAQVVATLFADADGALRLSPDVAQSAYHVVGSVNFDRNAVDVSVFIDVSYVIIHDGV